MIAATNMLQLPVACILQKQQTQVAVCLLSSLQLQQPYARMNLLMPLHFYSCILDVCWTGSAGPARYVLEQSTVSNQFGPVLF